MELKYTGAALNALDAASDADWVAVGQALAWLAAEESDDSKGRLLVPCPDRFWALEWRRSGSQLVVVAAVSTDALTS